jgi:hypothetical protein
MDRGQQDVERPVDVYVVTGLRIVNGLRNRSKGGLMKDKLDPVARLAARRRVPQISLD